MALRNATGVCIPNPFVHAGDIQVPAGARVQHRRTRHSPFHADGVQNLRLTVSPSMQGTPRCPPERASSTPVPETHPSMQMTSSISVSQLRSSMQGVAQARTQVPAGARVQHLRPRHERNGVVVHLRQASTTHQMATLICRRLTFAQPASAAHCAKRAGVLRHGARCCRHSKHPCSLVTLHSVVVYTQLAKVAAGLLHAAHTGHAAAAFIGRTHLYHMLWVHGRIEARPPSPCDCAIRL